MITSDLLYKPIPQLFKIYFFRLSKETKTTPTILIIPPITSKYNGVKFKNRYALNNAKIPFVLIINEVLNAFIYCKDL